MRKLVRTRPLQLRHWPHGGSPHPARRCRRWYHRCPRRWRSSRRSIGWRRAASSSALRRRSGPDSRARIALLSSSEPERIACYRNAKTVWGISAGASRFADIHQAMSFEAMPDLHDRLQRRHQFSPEWRKGVFDRRRRGRPNCPRGNTAGFQFSQSLRQDFGGDRGNIDPQFAEPPWPTAQMPDDIGRPGAGNHAHALRESTWLGRGSTPVLSDFQAHDQIRLLCGNLKLE